MSPRPSGLLFVAVLAATSACTLVPVSIERASPREVHQQLTGSVLTRGRPSERSMQLLERFGLRERFAGDPEAALAELHRRLDSKGDFDLLAGLAELSFHHAERVNSARYFLASAVYAYALLFPGLGEETLQPLDPRVRLACDLYNRGITGALVREAGRGIALHSGNLALPFGRVALEVPDAEFEWAGHRLVGLVAAADLEVHGLRNRYRRPGIGAPLLAELSGVDASEPAGRFIPDLRVPATLFLRLESPRRSLVRGQLSARAELYTPDEAESIEIDGRAVPLEFEQSAALAATLSEPTLWEFELRGFFSGAFWPVARAVQSAVVGKAKVEAESDSEGLLLLTPYRPGRIPLVLVHGTASSPGRWADLVNEVSDDRRLRDRYQVWLFLYNTGNPVGLSAGLLRRSLERAVARFDPEGRDAALRQMVVIGHSQGGLLTKLTAVDAGNRFWEQISRAPLEQLELSPEVRETLRLSAFFEPEPFVRRVVFICTPHRGSYLASFSYARLLSDLIAVPGNLTLVLRELLLQNPNQILLRSVARLPTSIDNMTPGHPFIRTLAELPIAPGIRAHSIIAVLGGRARHGSDGVVRYRSAHHEGVESELLVRSGHSAQGHPDVIEEVRRILREHAAQAAERTCPPSDPRADGPRVGQRGEAERRTARAS